jgi:hypothetical protein
VSRSPEVKTPIYSLQYLTLLLLCTVPLTALGDPVEIFGYGEFDNLLQSSDETELMTATKLRVDLLSTSIEGFTFGSNINFHLYGGQTTMNPLDFLPSELTAFMPEDIYLLYEETYSNDWDLDNCWLKMRYRFLDLTLGKQQLAFGSGYAWNPTDLFNRPNLLDVTYEQPGHQAARLDVATDGWGSFTLVASPAADLEDATSVIQWQRNINRFELSLVTARSPWFYTDYSSGLPTPFKEERLVYGGSMVGELFSLGVWCEYAYSDLTGDHGFEDFSELVLGSDYTFRNGLYLLGEYFWNGDGQESSDDYTLTDWLRMYSGETRSLARSQLYLYASYPATDLLSIGLTGLYCPSDGGAALVPILYYTPEAETEVTLMGNIYAGENRDQFSEEMGLGFLLRFRRYF